MRSPPAGPVTLRAYFAVLLAISTVGCATPLTYGVGVNSYIGVREDLNSRRIGVAKNTYATNPLLADEVQRKIEQMLREQGYRVVPVDSAELVLLNVFGIGSPEEIATGGVVLPFRNMIAYVPTSRVEYFRWLMLGVAPKHVLEAPGLRAADIAWTWVAEVTSSGSSGDLRLVIDAMLVASLEHFGTSTGRRIVVNIPESDPRVLKLRGGHDD